MYICMVNICVNWEVTLFRRCEVSQRPSLLRLRGLFASGNMWSIFFSTYHIAAGNVVCCQTLRFLFCSNNTYINLQAPHRKPRDAVVPDAFDIAVFNCQLSGVFLYFFSW